ncbi:Gastricsin [Leucoagaricus sp. SymC.cos]|nr:Gastricsin [Leucoagaricus sp. SymC.cos]
MKVPLTLSLVFAAFASAHKFSLKRIPKQQPHDFLRRSPQSLSSDGQVVTSNPETDFSLGTIHDLIYLVNITVGDNGYSVQLDTGSSDLWIKGSVTPLPGATSTDTSYNISYVLGWASGRLSYAPVEFIGLKVPKQAFIDVDQANNPVLGYGLDGIVGLGFTSLSSIDYAVNETSSDAGRSLLYNLFAVNPSEPNFLAFSLLRSTDPDGEAEGSFSIGEYEPKYAQVANTSRISTWPVHTPKRWTVLLDSVIVGGNIIVPTTQVTGAPSNKAVVLMDSGASYTYAPKSITDAIYANVTGAQFDEKSNQWLVPCDYEVDMAFQIGGQIFPLHPLDVAPATAGNNSTCVGSFIPTQLGAQSQFDWLVGDNFLRSVYAVYDFGDYDSRGVMGDPYMQLLSITNPDEASADFHKVRGGEPKRNITYVGLNGTANAPSFFISDDVSESIEMISRFVPAMLGVVALNALVLLGLVIGGLCYWMRKRRLRRHDRVRSTRGTRGRMTPMQLDTIPSYVAGEQSSPSGPAIYQPVSMALTEDTFVPPSPAFHKFDGVVSPGDRPKSIA